MTFNTRLAVVAIILALVILAGFALSAPHAREVREAGTGSAAASTTPLLSLKDTYKKGTHTLSGSVTAPDACTTISASAVFASTSGTEILLDLTMPLSTGMCLEVPTAISFSTTVAAPADTPISARINGAIASTTSS